MSTKVNDKLSILPFFVTWLVTVHSLMFKFYKDPDLSQLSCGIGKTSAFATLLVFFWFLAPIAAPLALYLSIRHWKEPCGIIPKSRVRLLVAGILALLEIIGMVIIAILIWKD